MCLSASERGIWQSRWSQIFDFVVGALHQVTFRGMDLGCTWAQMETGFLGTWAV